MSATCISTVDDEKVLPAQYIQFEDQIGKAYLKYPPKPYAGKMILFRATNQPLRIVPDPTLGWDGIPAELEIHDVPGRHRSVVAEPYVRVLALKSLKYLSAGQPNPQYGTNFAYIQR